MTTTPRWISTYITSGMTDPEAAVNDVWNMVDAFIGLKVVNRTSLSPPASVEGDCFIIAATGTPTGAWSTFANKQVVIYYGGQWRAFTPREGLMAWISAEAVMARYKGTSWISVTGESIYAGRDTAGAQNIAGSWVAIQWNSDIRKNDIFTHSTSSNKDQITLTEAGDYLVEVDFTIETSATAVYNRVDGKLTLNGSDVAGSFSSVVVHHTNIQRATLHLQRLITAGAGDVLRFEAQRAVGTSTIGSVADFSRITVTRK